METLTKQEEEKYFNILDNYFQKEKKYIEEKKYYCCDKQELYKDNTYLTCFKCGMNFLNNMEFITPNSYLNQRFHTCTLIYNSVKFKNIRRLQCFSNYCYKEVVMIKSFNDIEKICKKMKLSKKIIDGSKIKYKEIFIDLKISSRSNIKKAMYIYCIYFSCNYYKEQINLDELIKITEIEERHYNKVLKKLEKKNIIFSYKKINKLINICKKNNLKINKEKLIQKYKEFKKKKIKLNNNSILLGILFEMLDITENKFVKIFKTTKITLEKFKKTKYIEDKKEKIQEYVDKEIYTKEQGERALKEIKYQ